MHTLTQQQRDAFYHDGITVLPGILSDDLVKAAKRKINIAMGDTKDPAQLLALQSAGRPDALTNCDEVQALFHASPLEETISSLMDDNGVQAPGHSQIALRFPTVGEKIDLAPTMHLDGIPPYPERLDSFAGLAIALLSDLPEPWMGNFTVAPGSHRQLEKVFQQRGLEIITQAKAEKRAQVYQLLEYGDDIGPMAQPRQITGKAGDVILAHYQLGHAPALNLSCEIRYAVIYRLYPKLYAWDHTERNIARMTNIWLDWPNLMPSSKPALSV